MFDTAVDTQVLENPWTLAALVGLFLYLIITGSVFFKWQIDKMFKDKDTIIENQAARIKLLEEMLEERNGRRRKADTGD